MKSVSITLGGLAGTALLFICLLAYLLTLPLSFFTTDKTALLSFRRDYQGDSGGVSGAAMATIAEEQYDQYSGTACGSKYWPKTAQAWCCDFVWWCAQQAGHVGQDGIFGTWQSYCPTAVVQLEDLGAQILYPGDGDIPRIGDILFFWNNSRAGKSTDRVSESICHVGIVVASSTTTVTIVEGNCGSSDPAKSTIKRNTYTLTGQSWQDTYIYCYARPQYPTGALDPSDHGTIQGILIDLLYGGKTAYCSCDFDGYTTISGRHEGIDFAAGYGSSVYAVAGGTIVSIVEGTDFSSVSMVNVYDEKRDKTVVYMHLNPSTALTVGQEIQPGDCLGTESARGMGSQSSSHTHLEVINGLSYGAMKSTGDPVLDNDDPYPYWAEVLSPWAVSSVGGGLDSPYYLSIHNADPSYSGVAMHCTPTEKAAIIRTLYWEYGMDLEGCILVAQSIRDNAQRTGSVERVITTMYEPYGTKKYFTTYTGDMATGSQAYQNAVTACEYVFQKGGSAVQHKIYVYYTPLGSVQNDADFQKNFLLPLEFVCQVGTSRFFSWEE